MSRLQINLHQDFQPASRLPRANLRVLSRDPLSSRLSFLLSLVACLGGLLLVYLVI
jgi:hypothetical protein